MSSLATVRLEDYDTSLVIDLLNKFDYDETSNQDTMSTEEIKKENLTMHRVISRAVINLKKLKNDLNES